MTLQNANWIAFNGEPITGQVPPQLNVYGPELTGAQRGEVFHAYRAFCSEKRVAIGDYHVRNRVLGDGTKMRCVSINGRDYVAVWTNSKGAPEETWVGGFICRPINVTGATGLLNQYWGLPLTEENAPLGTLYGSTPEVILHARWDREKQRPTGEFRVNRFHPDQYGTADWQGPDPREDVLSWGSYSWESFSISNQGVLSVTRGNADYQGVSQRYRSRGYSIARSVYSKLGVVASFSIADGHVDGAAYLRLHGHRVLLVAMRDNAPNAIGGTFTFVAVKDGERRILGTHTLGERAFTTQGWYFSADGRAARNVVMWREPGSTWYYSCALHLDISGSSFDALSASVSEVPGSHGDNSTQESWAFTVTETISVQATGAPGAYEAIGLKTAALDDPEDISRPSGAFAADFHANTPLLAFIEDRLEGDFDFTLNSLNYDNAYVLVGEPWPGPSGGTRSNAIRTGGEYRDFRQITPYAVMHVLVKGFSEDKRLVLRKRGVLAPFGSTFSFDYGSAYQRAHYATEEEAVVALDDNGAVTLKLSGSIVSRAPIQNFEHTEIHAGAVAGGLVDLDLRHGAAIVYVEQFPEWEESLPTGWSEPALSATVTYERTTTTEIICSFDVYRDYKKVSSFSLPSYPVPRGEVLTTVAGPNGTTAHTYSNYNYTGSGSIEAVKRTHAAFQRWRPFSNFNNIPTTPYAYIGTLKTYYGEVLSQMFLALNAETAPFGRAYLSGKDNDPVALVEIDNKNNPALYKIGIV